MHLYFDFGELFTKTLLIYDKAKTYWMSERYPLVLRDNGKKF